MKGKPIMMMAITLIALLLLTPIAHAGVVYYYWDYIVYKQGTNIDYAHPADDYYDISNTEDWTIRGWSICHNQISKDKTNGIIGGALALCGILGLVITAWLGGGTTAQFVGGLTGIVLAGAVDVAITYYFVDERGCIWWWVSNMFLDYLEDNLDLFYLDPNLALGLITNAFLTYCYFRIGKVTFNNPLGIDDPPLDNPAPDPRLTISASDGGTTSPAPETYIYSYGSSVTVTAIPDSGYVLYRWLLDGQVAGVYNTITVTMNSDHTLEACFIIPHGGCPTLFIWNGTDWAEEGILDIHAESDVTVQHEIQNILALENGVYKLQLRELDNYTSHIDQVKLYAIDSQGKWNLCPLTFAHHSELGNMKQTLLFDDNNRVDLEPTEVIDLKFANSIPYSQTTYFIFEINGYNPKPMPR